MDLEKLRQRPTPEEINAMPLKYYQGDVRIIRSLRQWQAAVPNLRSDAILGFDTETKPTFCKGKLNAPALIQLATAKTVYLVQLAWFPFSEFCANILADANIIKVGVGIKEDMRALAKVYEFEASNIVDLGDVARANNLPNHGLRTLAASMFGWRISKSLQCSNWNLLSLSRKQIIYAATDAWISRLIYMRLKELSLVNSESDP